MNQKQKRKIKEIVAKSFLTGSRKFKVASDDADWNYVIKFDKFFPYKKLIAEKVLVPIDHPNYKEVGIYKIVLNKKKITIMVPYSNTMYYQWKYATKSLCNFPIEVLHNKKSRMEIFRVLKDHHLEKAQKIIEVANMIKSRGKK